MGGGGGGAGNRECNMMGRMWKRQGRKGEEKIKDSDGSVWPTGYTHIVVLGSLRRLLTFGLDNKNKKR